MLKPVQGFNLTVIFGGFSTSFSTDLLKSRVILDKQAVMRARSILLRTIFRVDDYLNNSEVKLNVARVFPFMRWRGYCFGGIDDRAAQGRAQLGLPGGAKYWSSIQTLAFFFTLSMEASTFS